MAVTQKAAAKKNAAPAKKAAAGKKAAPGKKKSTTTTTTTTSTKKKPVPPSKKTPPAAAKKAPVKKKASPAKKKVSPVKKKASPSKKKASPAKKKAPTPTKKKASPAKKKPAPAAKKAAVKKKSPAPANKKKPVSAGKAAKKPTAKKASGKGGKAASTGKRGLKGAAAPDASTRVGVVDSAANLSSSAVLVEEGRDEGELDAMLNQIDVSKNIDKYFILQVISEPASSAAKKTKTGKAKAGASSTAEQFFFFTRWGRTGASGMGKLEGPFDELDEATNLFNAKFKEKTGNDWDVDDHEDRYVAKSSKYTCLRPNKTQVTATTWQYWVDDKVDGKADGWYDYESGAALVVEQLNTEFQTNPRLSQRVVASGAWTYHADLSQMTQTNVTHPGRKTRNIRRNPGGSLPNTPPGSSGGKATKGKMTGAGAAASAASQATAEVDKTCPKAGKKGVSVCAGHDAKLNRTDISANNNKFYILQMCRDTGRKEWFVWCRWGRVGEVGATSELGPFQQLGDASTAFAKKFRDKTGNKWPEAQSGNFKAIAGKYELIETDNSDTTAAAAAVSANGGGGSSSSNGGPPPKVLPCTLAPATKALVELVFSEDMFKSAMSTMNVDVKKMPLGQLSKAQVVRGYVVLEDLEIALTATGADRASLLETLSARFYQVIPHSFGRNRPPVIDSDDMLREKVEMLNVLQDIGEAQSMLSAGESAKGKKAAAAAAAAAAVPAVPHPTDVNYGLLNAELELVPIGSHEYKTIKCYLDNTKPSYGSMELYDLWKVDRQDEARRFAAHDEIGNRKLLWHGTNVAVVAAIVKSGLRIMPHSGGRVGRGIYLASENAKSRQYVRPAYGAKGPGSNVGIMFLCEAALGKEASITVDDSKLTKPPEGHDCIVARGVVEPDPSQDVELTIDGKQVKVPQGKPTHMPAYQGSRFSNSEYLVYKESQQRIRYMVTVKC